VNVHLNNLLRVMIYRCVSLLILFFNLIVTFLNDFIREVLDLNLVLCCFKLNANLCITSLNKIIVN